MQQIPVKIDGAEFMVMKVEPVLARDKNGNVTGEQKRDRDERPVYKVTLACELPNMKPEMYEVKVAGDIELVKGDDVIVNNLVATYWTSGDSSGLSFKADAVSKASAKPAPTTKPGADKAAA